MTLYDFFTFRSTYSPSTIQAHATGVSRELKEGLSYDRKLLLGLYEGFQFPITFKIQYGRVFKDILDTGTGSLYLISEKMKNSLKEHQLTGWKTFPIRLLGKQDEEIQGYHGFSITGRCGPVDFSKSERILKSFVPEGPLSTFCKGFPIELDSWDGSDFFLPSNRYSTTVSKRAAEVIKKEKLTHIQLTRLTDYEIPEIAL